MFEKICYNITQQTSVRLHFSVRPYNKMALCHDGKVIMIIKEGMVKNEDLRKNSRMQDIIKTIKPKKWR